MASSTACSKSVIRRLRLWLLALAFLPALAWAAEIDIANPQLLAGDDVKKAFVSQGMDPLGSTPQAFAQLVERDAERWARLIKDQGIKAE